MIWRNWSTRMLLQELETIDPDLYENLVEIIPSLRGDDFDPTELSSKSNLVKFLMSFADSGYFEKKENMRKCMERLPPRNLTGLVRTLRDCGYDVKGIDHMDTAEKISKVKWNYKNTSFCRAFLDYFELPDHFLPPEKKKLPPFVDILPLSETNQLTINRPFKSLLDYQVQVYSDSMKKLRIPRSRFIVQMPTGSGKTRTSMEIIS